jgi:nitrite reductase/ring-hydroxylating ferredoxin subunit
MADDELDPRAERFDRYLDALLAGERPSPDDVADRDEAEMARLAAELSAAADPDLGGPDPAFLEQLRLRMRQADHGIAAVQEPLPLRPGIGPPRSSVRVTRRQLLQAGLVGAAGLAAGAVGATILRQPELGEELIWDDGSGLVSGDGRWFPVANLDDLPIGTALRFTTPAFEGYLVNDSGNIRALVAVCTHMGCSLHFRESWNDLRCPCHGASFDLNGHLANGRASWRENGAYIGDERPYPIDLPDLVRPRIKIEDGQIMVLTAEIQPPNTAGPID